jgi:hypothetical protein
VPTEIAQFKENHSQAGFTLDPEPSYMQIPQQPIEASSALTTRSDPGRIAGPARSSIHAAAAFTSIADAVAVAKAPVSLATTLRPLTGSNKARTVKIPDAIDLGLLASFEAAALFQRCVPASHAFGALTNCDLSLSDSTQT